MTTIRYGGQAVIEGVMMSGPKGKAIAVRNEDGNLVYKIEDKKPLSSGHSFLQLPVIRGVANFCSSMVGGIRDLTWSAAQAGETEDEKLSAWEIFTAVLTALIFSILVFIVFPVFLATWLHQYVGDFGRSLIEGLLRAALFLGYVLAISRMNDIKRLFAYHGAEHKTINAYEAGVELTPENVCQFSRIHVRCGTSFLMMVMILMIIFFTFVGQTDAIHRILIKIICLPLIAGLSYELFRLPLKYPNSKLVRILVAPGLAMQGLTTREPDLGQLETAIAALRAVPGFAGSEIDAAAAKAQAQRSRRGRRSRRSAAQEQPQAVMAETRADQEGRQTADLPQPAGEATILFSTATAENPPQEETTILYRNGATAAAQPEASVTVKPQPESSVTVEPQPEASVTVELQPEASVTVEPQPAASAAAEPQADAADGSIAVVPQQESYPAETEAQQPLPERISGALEQAGTRIVASATALRTRLAPAMRQARIRAGIAGRQAAAQARTAGHKAAQMGETACRKAVQLGRTAGRKAVRLGRITGCAVCLLADEAAGAVKRIVNEAEKRSARAADTAQQEAALQEPAQQEPALQEAAQQEPDACAADETPAAATAATAPERQETEKGKEEN